MIVYAADRELNILHVASTGLPGAFAIRDDLFEEDIDSGVASFSFDAVYEPDEHVRIKKVFAEGNYLLRKDGDTWGCFVIVDTEDEDGSMNVYAEDAGLDLLNDEMEPYTATRAYPISHYISLCTGDSGFTIGLNEITDRTRKLSWEGSQTAAARIRSAATQFDAEIGYSFEMKGLTITARHIDIYARRGKDIGQELRLGREVESIREKRSIANLATGLRVTGGIPDGGEDPITLEGYSYDDGDIYISGNRLLSRTALETWGTGFSGNGKRHIIKECTFTTTSQATLCTESIAKLKKVREPEVNYEVKLLYLPENLRIGDTVRIVDDNGELYLSARLLKLSVSIAEDKREAVFGDYLILSSGISARMQQLEEDFAEIAKTRTLYTWFAYADDAEGSGISLDPEDKAYIGVAYNRINKEPDISDPSIYAWQKAAGRNGADGKDAILLRIDSSRGTVFKNNRVETVLTVTIFYGSMKIEDINSLRGAFGQTAHLEWEWLRLGDETYGTISSSDSRLIRDGFGLVLTPDDVDVKITFRCNLAI